MSSFAQPAAKPFADCLFSLAVGTGRLAEIASQFESFASAVTSDAKSTAFFDSPRIPADAKNRTLDRLLSGRADTLVTNFLKVLSRRGRFSLLRDIAIALGELVDAHLRRVRVVLSTATPAGPDDTRAVTDAVRAKLGLEPILRTVVRPELIGGFVLHVGDTLVDASVAERLRGLSRAMTRRAAADIQQRGPSLAGLTSLSA